MKRKIALLLACLITITAFAGCNDTKEQPTDAPKDGESTTNQAGDATQEIPEVYYEGFLPMRIFENRGDSDPAAYAQMEQKIIDDIGVKPVAVWMPRGSETEKLNLMIASGDDRLDIVMSGKWSDYASKDVLLPLNDLLDEHGKDILAGYEPFSFMWDQMSNDDEEIYGVPRTLPLSQNPIWVRQDWLDTCGLTQPTTVDQLTNVLKAFKENDPAGNGQTIPMIASLGSIHYGVSAGFTKYGYGNWVDTDGLVKPGVMQPGYEDAIATVAEWYKNGYIYPESFTVETEKTNELILSNRIGSSMIIYSPICINLPELQKTQPNADYAYTDGFKGPEGLAETGQSPSSDSIMILKKSQNPEAAMKLLNWMMDKTNFISSYAGRIGVDWDWVSEEDSTLIRHDVDTYDGEFYMFPNNLMLRHLNILASPEAEAGLYTKFLTEDSYRTETVKKAQDYGVVYPTDRMDEMAPNRADIDRMIEEEIVKFVTGVRPMSDWENFINKDLKKAGVDAVINATTTIYNEQRK